MIKELEVLVNINLRNLTHYRELGYNIESFSMKSSNNIYVKTIDIPINSHLKITAICELCGGESVIGINKYYVNKNRNNKGFYSCFHCKNIEKEKTCIIKYGVKSYSQTNEYRVSESKKWKGIQKGSESGKKTMLERYGVDSFFKTDKMREDNRIWMSSNEFKEKSKNTLISKYGVDSYSKTDYFKKTMMDKKDLIVNKIRTTFMERYGVDWFFKTEEHRKMYKSCIVEIRNKIEKTCMERYGVNNVSKVESIMDKILKTKVEKGWSINIDLISSWILYKKQVKKLTNRVKRDLYEKWNGIDYYDDELIIGNFSYSFTNRLYPTIDHKISTFYGFANNLPASEIANISNLCITKRYINCIKNSLTESEFINQ